MFDLGILAAAVGAVVAAGFSGLNYAATMRLRRDAERFHVKRSALFAQLVDVADERDVRRADEGLRH